MHHRRHCIHTHIPFKVNSKVLSDLVCSPENLVVQHRPDLQVLELGGAEADGRPLLEGHLQPLQGMEPGHQAHDGEVLVARQERLSAGDVLEHQLHEVGEVAPVVHGQHGEVVADDQAAHLGDRLALRVPCTHQQRAKLKATDRRYRRERDNGYSQLF